MSADIAANPPASAGAAGAEGTNRPGYEAGAEGVLDADQGLADQSDGDLPEGEEGEQAPELDEIEHEGLKHQIPKALKPIIDMGLDYTRKTQQAAEERRATELKFAEREQQFAQQQQAAQTLHEGRAHVAALDMELAKFNGIDWITANAQNPAAAQEAFMRYTQLKDQRQTMAGRLQQAEGAYHAQASQQAQARVRDVVSKWSPEEVQAVSEIGTKHYGITPQHMALFGSNPALLNILKDAVMHQKAVEAASKATKPKQGPPAKPAGQLPQGSRSPVAKSMDDPTMSDAEWNKRRREQLRRRGR